MVRSVGIYDSHSMRDGEPLGHLILSKLRLQRRGRYYPAISIESIVSQNKKKGTARRWSSLPKRSS